jgi:hypothetical protein
LTGAVCHDVARELAHHVAARNPHRQHETLAGRIGIGDGHGDFEQMGGGLLRNDGVADRLHRRRVDFSV